MPQLSSCVGQGDLLGVCTSPLVWKLWCSTGLLLAIKCHVVFSVQESVGLEVTPAVPSGISSHFWHLPWAPPSSLLFSPVCVLHTGVWGDMGFQTCYNHREWFILEFYVVFQVAFLPLLARAGICHQHPHLHYFPPYMFSTHEREQIWAFRISTTTDNGLSLNSLCCSPVSWCVRVPLPRKFLQKPGTLCYSWPLVNSEFP